MLRRQRLIRTQIHELVDAALFAIGLWLAHGLRSLWPNPYFPLADPIAPFSQYLWLYVLTIPYSILLLEASGFYNRPQLASRRQTAVPLARSCIFAVAGVILLMFLLRIQLARSVIILFGGLSFLLVFAKEELIQLWNRTKLGLEQTRLRVVLVGTAEDTDKLADEFSRQGQQIEICARLNLNDTSVERLAGLLHEHSPNGVILTAKHTYFGQIEKAIEVCELEGVEVWLLAEFFKTQVSRTTLDEFQGRPMLVFRSAPEASWQGVAKQLMDVLGAALMLVVVGPFIMLPAALLIKRNSPGPIFFRQQRSGLNGRPFTMLKFRSMVTDAEQHQHELAAMNEMEGPVFKITADPRITPIGRWLRRFSIDELPQLWNVLRGEMSLVGPRPLPVDEVRRFNDLAHRRRLSVKPGLTCLWQISGRNEVKDFKDWVRLDLEYIDNWSLWLDFKILFQTIPVVLSGTGAK
jgi:exopolysaccharide biosynthesis polyprenyl glycosylphosphotransferase